MKYRTSVDIDSIFVDYNKKSQKRNNTKLHILKFPFEKNHALEGQVWREPK